MATFSDALVDAAPGNVIALHGSGLAGAVVTLANQGLVTPSPLPLPATVATDGSSIAFAVPDGVTSGMLTATVSGDAVPATAQILVAPQYLQVSQYRTDVAGTADDVADMQDGTLAAILRSASAHVDAACGTSLRLLQRQEALDFRAGRRGRGPRLWPVGLTRLPLVSVDALAAQGRAGVVAVPVSGASSPVYVNAAAGYIEIAAHRAGGLHEAELWALTYTAGYRWTEIPAEVREATSLIATALIDKRGMRKGASADGMVAYDSVREGNVQRDRRKGDFAVPPAALDLLRAWRGPIIR